MEKKTAEQLADILYEEYRGRERGSEFPAALDRVVEAGGYTDRDEIIAIKKIVVPMLIALAA
jgi:hypothetical protein